MLKKFSIIGLTLILGTTPILASVFPNTIWKPLDEYTLSKSENNLENQIAASEQVISIMTPEPESQERINILLNHHLELANAYNTIGNYEKAYENFKLYIPFGESQGHDVSYAYAKLMTLQPSLEVFQLNSNASAPYFDAKFEPTQGVIYGSYYDKDTYIGVAYNNEDIRSRYPSEESMLLVYLEFGQDIKTPYIQNMLNLAKEEDKLVFLAWNTAGSTLDTANSSQFPLHQTPQEYIASTIDYLSSQGLDALIRFGGEMNNGPSGRNVFTGEVDSAGFIESFQYVSNIAKQHDNIGMVWSPDDIGGLDTPFEMFYPGDEYVDWVGVSMYPKKYFRDEIDTSNNKDINESIFIAGEHANPIKKIEHIITFMKEHNIQKPIIISETGDHHFVRNLGIETTDWAKLQMQKTYTEMFYKYPQIKAINYFNNSLPWENSFALYDNDILLETYNALVSDELFIKEYGQTAPIGYKNITNGGIELGSDIELSVSAYYPYANNVNEISVKYWLDDMLLSEVTQSPYTINLAQDELAGKLELKVEMIVNGEIKQTQTINLMHN